MKTKLLKKIRREFSIVYYPNRGEHGCPYEIRHKLDFYIERVLIQRGIHFGTFKTLQQAKDVVLSACRIIYRQHTRKYKIANSHVKVWYK